jgi:hypothetical protein
MFRGGAAFRRADGERPRPAANACNGRSGRGRRPGGEGAERERERPGAMLLNSSRRADHQRLDAAETAPSCCCLPAVTIHRVCYRIRIHRLKAHPRSHSARFDFRSLRWPSSSSRDAPSSSARRCRVRVRVRDFGRFVLPGSGLSPVCLAIEGDWWRQDSGRWWWVVGGAARWREPPAAGRGDNRMACGGGGGVTVGSPA